jgi:hypothetical protein
MTHLVSALLFIWSGLLIGVSFVATPAKFLAPSLPLAQALDVGRWTLHVLGLIEWGFLAVVGILALLAVRLTTLSAVVPALLVGVALILALEGLWLRPALDQRVLQIMAGHTPPPNAQHMIYIGLEAAKLLLLLGTAIVAIRTSPESK